MPSLVELAKEMLAKAQQLEDHLNNEKLKSPNFDDDVWTTLPLHLDKIRWSLSNDANNFKKLLRGPTVNAMDIALNWTDALVLRIVYHYKLAGAVPTNSPATYADVAKHCGLDELTCMRIIRAAISLNIFDEDANGDVIHTAISRQFAANEGFRDGIGLHLEEFAQAAACLPETWERFGSANLEPTEAAFQLRNNALGQSIYQVLASDAERTRRFASAMRFYTYGDNLKLEDMLTMIDWTTLDKPGARVIDIGGGYGTVSQFLAKHTKHINYCVQDINKVIQEAEHQLPANLKDRVEFKVHDFFTDQELTSDDVDQKPPPIFLLRWILHNWSDQQCVQILQALIPALRSGSKILIYEVVINDEPVKDLTSYFGLQMDMIMLSVFNAMERREAGFSKLLEAADARFIMRGVRRPTQGSMSIIEVEWVE